MSHMVIFQTPDGNPGYNQFETIEEAVRFVEVLRNEQGVETARMFALEEVKFDFKPYFRVEIDPPMLSPGPSRTATVGTNGAGTASSATQPQAAAPASEPPVRTAPFTPQNGGSSAPAPQSVAQQPQPQAAPQPAPQSPRRDESFQRDSTSPLGSEEPVSSVPPPTFMAGAPSEGGEEQPATTRRGLFGR